MITNYDTLKTEIIDFIHRTDLSDKIPIFIQMAEINISRKLMNRSAEKRIELTVDENNRITIPTDLHQIKNISCNNRGLQLLGDDTSFTYSGEFGQPVFYTVFNDYVEFKPVPLSDTKITLTYYAKFVPLSDVNTTNWVLTKYPDLYLYASLIETIPYTGDMEFAQVWAMRFQTALDETEKEFSKQSFTGSPFYPHSDYIV